MLGDAVGPFLLGWTAMMAVMMLPSAMPMIRLFRIVAADAHRPRARTLIFVSGYLLVWAAVGLGVWLLGRAMDRVAAPETQTPLIAAALLLGGAYQLTPLKRVCLRACRAPMDFLLTHWYRGAAGALRLGAAHGWYCVGCCWALMAVFVFVGAMELAWAAAIAAVVFIEKVLPHGEAIGRGVGLALMVAAGVVLVRPDLASLAGRAM